MSFVAHLMIFLFMIPLVFGWLLLFAVPFGALAVGAAAAPFAFRQSQKSSRKRVLIVEDDLGMKLMLEQIVRSASPEAIITASDSEEGASRLLEEGASLRDNFDFVIADIFLAGEGTGIDLWRKYRHQETPFVFASVAERTAFDRMVATDAGGTEAVFERLPAFLQKPLDPMECVKVLRSL